MQLLSLPVGAILAFVIFVAWILLTPRFEISFAPAGQVAAACLLVMLAGMCLQILPHPGMGLTENSVLGLWPSRLTPYTAYSAKLPKRRVIASLLLPLGVLAVLPPLIGSIVKCSSGWLVFGSCLAAAVFGMNGFLAMMLALKVPAGGVVAGRGFHAYWRPVHEI